MDHVSQSIPLGECENVLNTNVLNWIIGKVRAVSFAWVVHYVMKVKCLLIIYGEILFSIFIKIGEIKYSLQSKKFTLKIIKFSPLLKYIPTMFMYNISMLSSSLAAKRIHSLLITANCNQSNITWQCVPFYIIFYFCCYFILKIWCHTLVNGNCGIGNIFSSTSTWKIIQIAHILKGILRQADK